MKQQTIVINVVKKRNFFTNIFRRKSTAIVEVKGFENEEQASVFMILLPFRYDSREFAFKRVIMMD